MNKLDSFRYDSDLIGGSLMVRESRLIAELLMAQTSAEEWQAVVIQQNILQKRSPASARRTAQAIRKRLERLEPPFWRALRDGDEELATQTAFAAALERNLLLVEFIETVVRDAFLTRAGTLEVYHWPEFLDDRSHRDAQINDWTESSRKKMAQVVYRMLAEVGLLTSTRSMELQNLLVRPELRSLLEHSGRHRILACMMVSAAAGKQ